MRENTPFKIYRLIKSTESFAHGIHLCRHCRRIIAFFNVCLSNWRGFNSSQAKYSSFMGVCEEVSINEYVEQVARWWAIRQPATLCTKSTFIQSFICNDWMRMGKMQMIFETSHQISYQRISAGWSSSFWIFQWCRYCHRCQCLIISNILLFSIIVALVFALRTEFALWNSRNIARIRQISISMGEWWRRSLDAKLD